MKRLSWKYVAGLVDGEGCIDFQTHDGYARPRLRIGMSVVASDLIKNLHENFGGYITNRRSGNEKWADSMTWELTGYRQVCPVLRNIVNHLIIKQEQARFALWMESNIKGKHVTEEVRRLLKGELQAMKRDPHRLSERAQEAVLSVMRQSDYMESVDTEVIASVLTVPVVGNMVWETTDEVLREHRALGDYQQ